MALVKPNFCYNCKHFKREERNTDEDRHQTLYVAHGELVNNRSTSTMLTQVLQEDSPPRSIPHHTCSITAFSQGVLETCHRAQMQLNHTTVIY